MSKHTASQSDADRPDADFNLDANPAPATTPVRFGRLALWVASASALAAGVVGTVAYGVWFNQDQHAYTEAMENARQTLWITASTPAAQPTSSSGYGDLSSSTPSAATVSSVDLNAPVFSTQLDRRAAPSRNTTAPKLATTRPDRASCSASLDRHRPASRTKSNSLFTRVGSFFHRVSYRQRDTEGQRDIYSRP
ncbi:hypothetical protein M0D69_26470 [Caballeronia sp. SEWSISQ10-4 2]|uniref:hypothetical protein n=1 Tax=Caballeronia sp. SEWSISQ10-4 2 TaxID=2937438 RepID=UPI0026558FCC|nr:hypothetical protein [Caballeronia sp. SEWSISQ10-4 2]MDN7181481.1 hypothetical protein [Caballeronia sp. SEWSISQ10-4 2]